MFSHIGPEMIKSFLARRGRQDNGSSRQHPTSQLSHHQAENKSTEEGMTNGSLGIQSSTKSQRESASLHRDLAIAKEVQEASFPRQLPVIPGLNCVSYYKPAHGVGGDYYDFLPLKKGAWRIAIGDVSGNGIGAALGMANLQGLLRGQTLHAHADLEEVMAHVNRLVCETSPQHFFASLFYSEYQPQSRVLRYVNAGHNAPLVLRRRHKQSVLIHLTPEHIPIGLLKNTPFTSTSFQLEINDVFVAYTDGVTELENSEGNPFEQIRLEKLLRDCCFHDPQSILQLILDELSAHSAGCSQADDITLLVMHVRTR
jgi:phosphoserine phosphatase RsbU/P